MVSDTDIIHLVGLETYQALSYLYPKIFNPRYIVNQIKDYYIQLIQSVLVSGGLTPTELKNQLKDYITSPNENSPVISLVNSSASEINFPNTFMENAMWFLIVSIAVSLLIFVLVKNIDRSFV